MRVGCASIKFAVTAAHRAAQMIFTTGNFRLLFFFFFLKLQYVGSLQFNPRSPTASI